MPGTLTGEIVDLLVPHPGGDRRVGHHRPGQTCEREHAFSDSDMRLLQTAREQHERRAGERPPLRRDPAPAEGDRAARAELAVINSIQEGLAAELDFQAIIDLVGDKLREVLAHRRYRHPLVRSEART